MPEVKKPFWRRLIEFRLLFLINAGILVALGFAFGREYIRNREIQNEISRLQSESSSLQARNLEIADLNTAFRTESFIEREARLKLGMKKPGENVVVIQQTETQPVEIELSTDKDEDESDRDPRLLLATEDSEIVANPLKWWQYFIH